VNALATFLNLVAILAICCSAIYMAGAYFIIRNNIWLRELGPIPYIQTAIKPVIITIVAALWLATH